MSEIYLHGSLLQSVFELLGDKENDITYSIAWTLSRSDSFLNRFLRHVVPNQDKPNITEVAISIQEHAEDGGFTDIELKTSEYHIIIEAKRGWELPGEEQLRKYVPRFEKSKTANPIIVSMSEASQEFAKLHFEKLHLRDKIGDIPVIHVPYSTIAGFCIGNSSSHAEKRLLAELHSYLSRIVPMQKQESNWVYVVALNNQERAPGLTSIQMVEDRNMYFHPFGVNGFPKEPPNYIGFRYAGRLQSIRHVRSTEVITNFHRHFPEFENREVERHLLYKLGPAIVPPREVTAGAIFGGGKKWAMLDLLLTCETISDAAKESKERVSEILP